MLPQWMAVINFLLLQRNKERLPAEVIFFFCSIWKPTVATSKKKSNNKSNPILVCFEKMLYPEHELQFFFSGGFFRFAIS